MSGYLYIVINDAFPGWVKVGTTSNLTQRIHTYQTGDPFRNYRIVFSLHHPDFRQAEKKIKDTIKPFALSIRNEWYEIDLQMAKSRLIEVLESYENGEWK